MAPPTGWEFPYPHHVAKEPYGEHRYQPTHHLDIRGSIIGSRLTYARATGKFWLPKDKEFFRVFSNAALRAGRGVDSECVTELFAQRASKDKRLRRELDESNKKARRLDEALWERDCDMVQANAHKQVTLLQRVSWRRSMQHSSSFKRRSSA
ncbi:uncharacterized protein A4U43_C08F19900 [Asparagus officinalis]|nr:uncharacterized protein A4U43_C08F19900 [Asparagus officinalis]